MRADCSGTSVSTAVADGLCQRQLRVTPGCPEPEMDRTSPFQPKSAAEPRWKRAVVLSERQRIGTRRNLRVSGMVPVQFRRQTSTRIRLALLHISLMHADAANAYALKRPTALLLNAFAAALCGGIQGSRSQVGVLKLVPPVSPVARLRPRKRLPAASKGANYVDTDAGQGGRFLARPLAAPLPAGTIL